MLWYMIPLLIFIILRLILFTIYTDGWYILDIWSIVNIYNQCELMFGEVEIFLKQEHERYPHRLSE